MWPSGKIFFPENRSFQLDIFCIYTNIYIYICLEKVEKKEIKSVVEVFWRENVGYR